MADLNGFNANEVEPNVGFDPIPAGEYLAKIIESEQKPTRKGNGSLLSLKFQILDGQYVNRTLFANLNLHNPNETAVKIARGDLSAICRAVGVMTPRDSLELHNLPLVIKVVCKKRADNDEMTNVIKAFKPKGEYKKVESQTQSQAAGAGAAPWKKPA